MKKLVLLFFIAVSALSFSATLVNYDDKKGDDNGPGVYKYPQNKVFIPGAFDLLNFQITDEGDNYNFKFTIPVNFKNDWKNDNGWDVQMFDVYLNFDKGVHHESVAGRNVKFKEGWDKVLIVSPANNEMMLKREIVPKNESISDDESEPENLIADILLPDSFVIDKNVLTAKIAKSKIPGLENLKLIQVLVEGSEGYPSKEQTYIRATVKDPSEWKFSGGSDYGGAPNIMDMLGDHSGLKNYTSTEEKTIFATISLIDPKKAAPVSKPAAPAKKEAPKKPAKK